MRAVVITDTSNRSVSIEDVADPVPGDDEILVNVKACGVNFTDLLSLDGMTPELADELARNGAPTREDLAEMGTDEIVGLGGLDEEQAGKLIMAARAH